MLGMLCALIGSSVFSDRLRWINSRHGWRFVRELVYLPLQLTASLDPLLVSESLLSELAAWLGVGMDSLKFLLHGLSPHLSLAPAPHWYFWLRNTLYWNGRIAWWPGWEWCLFTLRSLLAFWQYHCDVIVCWWVDDGGVERSASFKSWWSLRWNNHCSHLWSHGSHHSCYSPHVLSVSIS